MNLVEAFSEMRDFRRAEGRRYPLIPMLITIIMSIACGCPAYREIERFAKANAEQLAELFHLSRKAMPSHVTIRTLIQNSDFDQLCRIFENWARQYVSIKAEDWLSIDRKSIFPTVLGCDKSYDKSYQDFVSLVSVFSQRRGQAIGFDRLHNKKSREIPTVGEMIRLFDLETLQGINPQA